MRIVSFACGFRIAVVLLALGGGRAFAGFTDTASGGEVTSATVTEEPVEEQALEFSLSSDGAADYVPPVQQFPQRTTPPATAPLPVALLPGGILLAGSLIATRVFKRRIV